MEVAIALLLLTHRVHKTSLQQFRFSSLFSLYDLQKRRSIATSTVSSCGMCKKCPRFLIYVNNKKGIKGKSNLLCLITSALKHHHHHNFSPLVWPFVGSKRCLFRMTNKQWHFVFVLSQEKLSFLIVVDIYCYLLNESESSFVFLQRISFNILDTKGKSC